MYFNFGWRSFRALSFTWNPVPCDGGNGADGGNTSGNNNNVILIIIIGEI